MRPRPSFRGDFSKPEDLAAYEADLRAWEEEREEERIIEMARLVDQAEERLKSQPGMAELVKASQPIVLFGRGEPDDSLGSEGNGYIDYVTTDLWVKGPRGWVLLSSLSGGGAGGQGPEGPQGPPGDPGMNGAPGNDWRVGNGDPALLGGDLEGDLYLDVQPDGAGEGNVWQVQSGAWVLVGNIHGATGPQGPQGDPGPQGPQGDPGPPGADGEDGATLLSGNGPPIPSIGVDGDFYIDVDCRRLYGPKGQTTPGVWDTLDAESLKIGDLWLNGTGDPNDPPHGGECPGDIFLATDTLCFYRRVNDWMSPAPDWVLLGRVGINFTATFGEPPDDSEGKDGDFAIDENGDIYQKIGGTWTFIISTVGPQGPAGADGQGVPTGGAADEYLAKIDGTDFNTEWRPFQQLKLLRKAAGGGTQALAGTVDVIFGTAQYQLGGAWYTLDSNTELTINETGYYILGFHIDVDSSVSTMTESRVRIQAQWERDNGGGFVGIGHTVQIAEDSEFMDNQSLSVCMPELLNAGDVLKITAQKVAGDDTLLIRKRNSYMWIMKLEPAGPPVVS